MSAEKQHRAQPLVEKPEAPPSLAQSQVHSMANVCTSFVYRSYSIQYLFWRFSLSATPGFGFHLTLEQLCSCYLGSFAAMTASSKNGSLSCGKYSFRSSYAQSKQAPETPWCRYASTASKPETPPTALIHGFPAFGNAAPCAPARNPPL